MADRVVIKLPDVAGRLDADFIKTADAFLDKLPQFSDDINKVGNSINAIGDSIDNINKVADSLGNINTVSSNIDNINTVSSNINSVNTVSLNINNINKIVDSLDNINTVSANINNVNTVSSSIDSVNITAGSIDNVNTYAKTYIGPKDEDPDKRNDGSDLQLGDLYFNTNNSTFKVYSKDSDDNYLWQVVSTPDSALLQNNNLSDLNNVNTALDNLHIYNIIATSFNKIDYLQKQINSIKNNFKTNKSFIGCILAFPIKVNRKDLLELNGQEVKISDYQELYDFVKGSIIPYTTDIKFSGKFKLGKNGDTIILPDYRGVFLRAFDDGRKLNPYKSELGEYKPDVFKAHTHNVYYHGSIFNNRCVDTDDCNTNVNDSWTRRNVETDMTGGKETTPKYINIVYYIQAK